jgi:hypothetical protein
MSLDFNPDAGRDRDAVIPRFYTRAVQNNFKTGQEGRPIFDNIEYVEMIIPGDRMAQVDCAVKQEHRERWPRQYEAFQKGQELAQEGTPLEEWSAVTRSQVEEMKHFHVRTVETLAALSDAQLAKAVPMGGFALREKAQRFLAQAAGSAPAEKLAAEVDTLRGTLAVMQEQMDQLAAVNAALRAKEDRA